VSPAAQGQGWIKVCGLSTAAGVQAALDAGADAIGFVFAQSVRRVTPERAAELARAVRARVTCVAVTRHAQQYEIDAVIGEFRPDLLQADAADFALLRLPRRLARLPVLRGDEPAPAELPARVLYEGERSGSGETADWQRAAQLARRTHLVLAGGLDAANVGAAIRAVRPFGVDASSGLEDRPGVKSPARIAAFVLAARAAFAEIET
jgi:phosphoribosylanthranilate isomerase